MPLRFLNLPREMRDQIYNYIFTSPTGYIILVPGSSVKRCPFKVQHFEPWATPEYTLCLEDRITFGLLSTCKQVHEECKDLFWKANCVWLPNVMAWHDLNPLVDRRMEIEKQQKGDLYMCANDQ